MTEYSRGIHTLPTHKNLSLDRFRQAREIVRSNEAISSKVGATIFEGAKIEVEQSDLLPNVSKASKLQSRLGEVYC